ncbi:putative PurR-regulated permease PerM [Volucribacter psittacicida]|uniref:Putative PurR-regulated permease PerM n=1 Tax=Volucribacter psittacicida TaxID=203482 RepID=A0A4R1G5U5_9PAST|nr:AI-2E family transporter [Volucribacter psittacicida]TCK01900.1 putative PurR-regulated permease PerM [Volucribacter psittacicida]
MKQSNSLIRAFIIAACLVIILAGVKSAVQIVVPFLLSLFIAIICSPLITMMTNRKIPRWLAISLLFVLILLIFFFLVGLINSTIKEFTSSIPQYRALLTRRVDEISAFAQSINYPLSISQEAILENFDPSVIMDFVSKVLLSFSGAVSNVFILLLVVIFMLIEAPTAKHKMALAFSQVDGDVNEHERNIDRILNGVIRYLGVKTLISLATGVCVWILLEILGVQYAVLWATLSFLLNYIPNIGSIIAAIPIVVQVLLLNGFSTGIIVASGLVGINMVIGNVIEPRLMGKTLGLSTLIVFLSLLFWGWLLGSVGMLLSVPLTMALKIALESSPQTKKYAALLGEIDENKQI